MLCRNLIKFFTMNIKLKSFFALIFVAVAACAQDVTWISAKAIGAVFMDHAALRATPMVQKRLEGGNIQNTPFTLAGKQYDQLLGVDLTKKADKVLAVMFPGESADDMHGVAYVTGSFDTDAIAAKLKANSSCKTAVKDGVTVYSTILQQAAVPGENAANHMAYIAIPRKGVLVSSDNIDNLMEGIRVLQKKAPAIDPKSKIAMAISKKYPVVFVADTSSFAKKGDKLPYLNTDMPQYVAMTVRSQDASSMLATLTGVFSSAEEAQTVVSSLTGMKMIFAMQMASQPNTAQLAKVISNINISSKAENVSLALTVDEATLAALTSSVKTAK